MIDRGVSPTGTRLLGPPVFVASVRLFVVSSACVSWSRRVKHSRSVALGLCHLLVALSFAACRQRAQEAPFLGAGPAAQLQRKSYSSLVDGTERHYFLYLPAGYDRSSDAALWPLMLFLHGGGERGDGPEELDYVLAVGPLYEAWIQKRDLPFVILAPQLPKFGREAVDRYLRRRDPSRIPQRLEEGVPPRPQRFRRPGPMRGATPDAALQHGPEGLPQGWPLVEDDVIRLLDRTLDEERIDRERVYLTGVSYGGFGTWYLASRHPQRFAAISPVVGWGHPDLMPSLAERRMPIWVFAGGRDRAVPARYFYPGLNALEQLGHRQLRFTIHEDMAHDVWSRVYAGDDLYAWLLAQRLPTAAGETVIR